MSDSFQTDLGTRLLFAILGGFLGAFAGWWAYEELGAPFDPIMAMALGAVAGALLGLIAPPLLELVMHLF